jgi:hypothetical protein
MIPQCVPIASPEFSPFNQRRDRSERTNQNVGLIESIETGHTVFLDPQR